MGPQLIYSRVVCIDLSIYGETGTGKELFARYIEIWGRGTLKIQKLMRDAGLPRPEFNVTDHEFTIRFFPAGKKGIWSAQSKLIGAPETEGKGVQDGVQEELSETARKILSLCSGESSAADMLKSLGYKSRNRNFREALAALMKTGRIKMPLPERPQSKKQKYRLTEYGCRMKEKFGEE